MKKNRKVISLILVAFIGVSVTLAGCSEKEALPGSMEMSII